MKTWFYGNVYSKLMILPFDEVMKENRMLGPTAARHTVCIVNIWQLALALFVNYGLAGI